MKKKKLYILLIVVLVIILIFVALAIKNYNEVNKPNHSKDSYGSLLDKEPELVSVIQLIAAPEKYDGKFVEVLGILCIENEGNAIYLSKDDYKYNVTKNAVSLDLNIDVLNANEKDLEKFKGHYALMAGTFNKNNNGHFGLFSGCIENVTAIADRDNVIRSE